jgi:tRNA G37 N-methylase TrmD
VSRRRITREAYGIGYAEQAAFKDTYGGVEGVVFLESYRLRPVDLESDTVLVFMHPVGGGAYLPMVTELAKQGNHVIYAGSRYRGVDSGLIMEKVVLDLAAAIRDAKDRFG